MTTPLIESSLRLSHGPRPRFDLGRRRLGIYLILCGCFAFPACDETGPRVYTAMPFDAASKCLSAYVPLGLVDADALPATCAPVCLSLSGVLYVSEVCPPYPAQATLVTPSDSADCKAALALIGADGGACPADAP